MTRTTERRTIIAAAAAIAVVLAARSYVGHRERAAMRAAAEEAVREAAPAVRLDVRGNLTTGDLLDVIVVDATSTGAGSGVTIDMHPARAE